IVSKSSRQSYRFDVKVRQRITPQMAADLFERLQTEPLPDSVIRIVGISTELDKEEGHCREAATLLSYHNTEARTHAIESDAGLAMVLDEHAAQWKPKLVVMGAYGVGGIRAAFFGSETLAMLGSSRTPLFLAQ
ncbi:MAG: universal stress protein, partial [Pirellulales bacterium]